MCQHISTAPEQFNKLIHFRQAAYARLGAARDALFELGDAVLLTPHVHSLADLSLAPVFRRRWPSVYAALADSHLQRAALLRMYTAQMPTTARPVLAGDHTVWPRLKAWTLRDRTVEHQPTAVPGNRPITLGHGYSTLVWVPEPQGSWALPLLPGWTAGAQATNAAPTVVSALMRRKLRRLSLFSLISCFSLGRLMK